MPCFWETIRMYRMLGRGMRTDTWIAYSPATLSINEIRVVLGHRGSFSTEPAKKGFGRTISPQVTCITTYQDIPEFALRHLTILQSYAGPQGNSDSTRVLSCKTLLPIEPVLNNATLRRPHGPKRGLKSCR
jgi:hypothetical protein